MHIYNFFESHAALKEKCLASPPTAIFAEKSSTKRRKTIIKKRKVQASILAGTTHAFFFKIPGPHSNHLCTAFVCFDKQKNTPSHTCTMSTGSTIAQASADYEPGAHPPPTTMRPENVQPPPAVPPPAVHSLPTPQTKQQIIVPLNWMPSKKTESKKLKTNHIASVFGISNDDDIQKKFDHMTIIKPIMHKKATDVIKARMLESARRKK